MDAFNRQTAAGPGDHKADSKAQARRLARTRLKQADRQMLATVERYTDGETCSECGAPSDYMRLCSTCQRWGEPVASDHWQREPALSRYVQALNLRAVLRLLWPERPELVGAPETLARDAWRQMGERQRAALDRAGCGVEALGV